MNAALEKSLDYLASSRALESLKANSYYPKWDSPWWHMLLLFEMGHADLIPEAALEGLVRALDASPLKIFPIQPGDMPPGTNTALDTHCHCALGNIYQVLAAAKVDVDRELPWMRSWFLRYQMADGGLNCDSEAYLVKGECPSSMVGTIAVFEAVLNCTPRPFTPEELVFLDKGASFLCDRQLIRGSATRQNAEEQETAPSWLQPCFPRFYFYDVLRGLTALTRWAEKFAKKLPVGSYEAAYAHLQREFPDGEVECVRRPWQANPTRFQTPEGTWIRKPAESFPLLDEVSAPGPNPFLTREWAAVRSVGVEVLGFHG